MNPVLLLKSYFSRIIAILSAILLMFQNGQLKDYHTVVFYDNDNSTVLSAEELIADHGYAPPPSAPEKPGRRFLGWSGNYMNVTQDEAVRAVYDDEKNVFIVASGGGKVGDTVDIIVSLDGVVNTCGFDITIKYDQCLKLVSYDGDMGFDVVKNKNEQEHEVYLNFSSAMNKTKKNDIVQLSFFVEDTSKQALAVLMCMNSIKEIQENRTVDSDYVLVDGVILVES